MAYTYEFKQELVDRINRSSAEEFEKADLLSVIYRMFVQASPNYYAAIWDHETKTLTTGAVNTIEIADHLMALNDNHELITGKLLQRGSVSFAAFAFSESEAYEIMRRDLPERFKTLADTASGYVSRTRDEWHGFRPDIPEAELDARIEFNRRRNQNRCDRALEQLEAVEAYPMKFEDC